MMVVPRRKGVSPRVTGKSAGCPAFLPVGRGGEESRPCNHIYLTRKPRPEGGELHLISFD